MDMVMNWAIVLLFLGAIVSLFGMMWAMVDGRLWNNPGETVMHWGFGIVVISMFIMLVAFLVFAVQCAINNGICPL
jgi:NADH:ubiquinone oxidoreductase subunit 6 (subunit J)